MSLVGSVLDVVGGLGAVEVLAVVLVVGVGGTLALRTAVTCVKSLLVGLAFRHVVYASGSAVAGSLVSRYVDGGLWGLAETALDLALGLVGIG